MKYLLLLATLFLESYGSAQDIIYLKTGSEINGKVTKVGTTEIEYKKDSTSPVYAIKKSEIFMVKYENGSKDVLANLSLVETKKESAIDLKLKYERHKRGGIALLALGGSFLLIGASISPVGDDVALITGLSLIGASIPLLISGGTEIHKYVKYKRQWKEAQRSLSFAPNGISLTF